MARHPVVDDEPAAGQPAAAPMSEAVFRQVKANLEELGRILGRPAFVSLYDLLGLDPSAPQPGAGPRPARSTRPATANCVPTGAAPSSTTCSPPSPALLLDGDPEAYLDMLAADVTGRLRPRVSAAVLVEDELTADDYTHMVGEAEALGLDHDRAVEVGVDAGPRTGCRGAAAGGPGRATARRGGARSGRRPAPAAPSDVDLSPGAAARTDAARPVRAPSRTPAGRGRRPARRPPKAWHDKLSEARAALRRRAGHRGAGQGRGGPPARRRHDAADPGHRRRGGRRAHRGQPALDGGRWPRSPRAGTPRRPAILERIQAIAADVAGPNGRIGGRRAGGGQPRDGRRDRRAGQRRDRCPARPGNWRCCRRSPPRPTIRA